MLTHPRTWFTAVVVWAVALFMLSHQSHLSPPGPEFDNKDKVLHATYFALGGISFFMTLRLTMPSMSVLKTCIWVVLFCSLVGVADEYHQSHVPNRSGNDVGDWLADTLGGMIACGACLLVQASRRPKSSSR